MESLVSVSTVVSINDEREEKVGHEIFSSVRSSYW